MQFLGFSGEDIEQQDLVGTTSADVDVCPSVCSVSGDLIDIEFEQFTQTRAAAIFMNMGASPILLDHYIVSIPGSGIPDRTANVAAILPGGTCSNSPRSAGWTVTAASSPPASTSKRSVEVLIFDFIAKELVRGEKRCPRVDFLTGLIDPGTVIPQTYQTNVIFSGSDASGQRFTVRAGLVAGFFDANNCQASGGGN